jgi:hypothetical protein
MTTPSVSPEYITRQRTLNWPDIHPEDYCHRCGQRNPSWYAEAEDWRIATARWSSETGREGICCPTCFIEMHDEATPDVFVTWRLVPHVLGTKHADRTRAGEGGE